MRWAHVGLVQLKKRGFIMCLVTWRLVYARPYISDPHAALDPSAEARRYYADDQGVHYDQWNGSQLSHEQHYQQHQHQVIN